MTSTRALDPSRRPEHPSPRALERAAFSPSGEPVVASHLNTCPMCRRQVEQLKEERQHFLQKRPARHFVAHLLERQTSRPVSWWAGGGRWRRWLAISALCAAALLTVVVGSRPPPAEDIALKGGDVQLRLLTSRSGEPATELPPHRTLREGDLIKFVVTLPEDGFVFIANLDERGSFTRYFPADQPTSAALKRGEHILPGSIALDSFRGRELLVLLVSKQALQEDEVKRALVEGGLKAGGKLEAISSIDLPARVVFRMLSKGP